MRRPEIEKVVAEHGKYCLNTDLVSQHLGPGLLCLLLVDVLHEDTLVLESVTLGFQVELVVQVTVNLLGLPVKCVALLQLYKIRDTFLSTSVIHISVEFLNI